MMRRASLLVAAYCGLHACGWAAEPLPPGIGVRITMAGPTFVDSQGMTLYQRNHVVEQGIYPCPDRPETIVPLENVGYNQVEEFPMKVPDAGSRRSCTDKYPPLLAPAEVKPVGHWTIHVRENGLRQWAYRGKPLHRTIKDKAPGQFNAQSLFPQDVASLGWGLASSTLEAPRGIQTSLTTLGLALTNHKSKPLYYRADGTTQQVNESWKPFLAPVAATTDQLPAGWSIVHRKEGLRQWAWKGKPLYTFVEDDGEERPRDFAFRRPFVDVFGEPYGRPIPGWQPALLKPALPPPAGVRVTSLGSAYAAEKIYADARGHTLYMLSCSQGTIDRLDCDDVGDSPRYWLSFCGGEERCTRDWQFFTAPKDAEPVDGIWSVAMINPRHPYKPLAAGGEGIAVWTYQGKIVVTFAGDKKPGDMYGAVARGMAAATIPAFQVQ